jgi:hypothetical protein
MNMNRKQRIALLCGIVAAVLGILNVMLDVYDPGVDIYLVIVAALTAGSVYNFRDKEGNAKKDKESGGSGGMSTQ